MAGTKLRFGTPQHGWLELTLGAAAGEHRQVVSDVPIDSLAMLAQAALALLDGRGAAVEWSLEPEYEVWTFTCSGDQATLEAAGFVLAGSRRDLATMAWRGLADLQARWPNDNEHWSHDFPAHLVADLRARVHASSP